MTVRRWLLIGPLVLLLMVSAAPAAFGQSTPTGEAGPGTCIPEGGIPPKDSYLIGMSQANKGEPWRQAMNDQIAAAAAAHPEL
jgi:ribose transport system substrate-binding protein